MAFSGKAECPQQELIRVKVADFELGIRRCFRDSQGPVVFVLSDFGSCSADYLSTKQGEGLAAVLALRGYDVFIGDWRGKGGGWPSVSRRSRWGVHQIITQDIPALLQQVERTRPGQPVLWIGEGFSSVLLVACLSRMQNSQRRPMAVVHIDPMRRRCRGNVLTELRHLVWRIKMVGSKFLRGVAGWGFTRLESSPLLAEILAWQSSAQWQDPVDGFNYRVAARCCNLPPSLYVHTGRVNRRARKWSMRLWLEELGAHDAQVLGVEKAERHGANCTDTRVAGQMVAGHLDFFQVVDRIDEITQK